MKDAFVVRRGGGGASLNYKVVGGTTQPTSAKENTIWVNTSVDKEAISKVETTQLSYYIKDTTGVVTKPSSNTCYTRYFECVEGHQYRFQMDDGTTVLIASFTEVPNTGVTGTVLYGTGKTHGADTLDYTVTAESGVKYLGIYCYDSSANDSVPVLTVTDITIQNGLPDEMKIAGHIFSATQPENPVEGMVWFQTGASSVVPFNAIKKNGLWVYPNACRQYINSTWIKKVAEIYQNGGWKEWAYYIFDNGGLGDSGGFTNATVESTYIVTASSQAKKLSNSVNLIDLTGYSTLEVDMKKSANTYSGTEYGRVYIGFAATSGSTTFAAKYDVSKAARGVYTLDISNLTGEYYFTLRVWGNYDSAQTATVYSIRLLP